ncbi:MAG TPA: LacI family transcriptional regulator [Candidatus Enterocloster faecavium]|uniref:LacI family transcriptional regulator n=1 Tax=Candidatus Enterocloster faecavium TaxID=2838560 RepID=A0A9D2L9I0_9FIRM|nr:LacI family transcriptional regulator [Candidatus Enterocloster faecavium]
MKKRVTRNDVAKLAGVSPAVVSYVMNNSNYVSEEKRTAVLNAVKELNYTPNIFAKSLRTNRSNQIALVGDTLQAELYGELSNRLFEKGYFSTLFFSHKDDSFINKLIEGRYEAIFMASNAFEAHQLNRIVENGIPLILYQSRNYEGLDPRIVIRVPDFYDGVRRVLNFLILKGHKRIAYIPPLLYQATGAEGNDFRAKAYSDTLRENNIEVNPDFFSIHTQSESSILEDVFFMMTSYKADQRPTALVASDDHIAAQVLRYVKKLNLSVPDDVAIVGWGNIASSQITTPELTTVDTEIPYFAYEVSEALIQMAQGIKVESKLYKGRLIIRGST